MKALLILNGEKINKDIMLALRDESEFILSADGGTDYCLELGIKPDLVIGDLDSISVGTLEVLEKAKIPVYKFPVKKDKTDSELCIEYLMDIGATEITIAGAIGNRIDHSIANILLLKKINDSGFNGKIVHNYNTIYLINNELVLDRKEGYFVSIIPIESKGITVTLKGFEYELNNTRINFTSTHGISNIIRDNKGYIKLHEGQCLVIVARD